MELPLDPGVDVLGRRVRRLCAGNLATDRLDRADDRRALILGQDARRAQGQSVRPLQLQLTRKKEPVLLQAAVDRRKRRMQLAALLP